MDLKREDYVASKYHIGTESFLLVASFLGLEHQHPTMNTLWGHGRRLKIR